MALLRLRCFPSSTHLSTHHQTHLLSSSHKHSITTNLSFSFCHSPSSIHTQSFIKTKNTSSTFTLKFSSTSQEQVLHSSTEEGLEFSQTRLLASNVPWTSTPEDIRSLFERYGRVLEVEISMYNKTRNRGLAFVEMGSPEEALAALKNLESYEYEGRIIRLNYARPKKIKTPPPVKSPKPITFNLFVANMSYEARSKDLKEFFDSGSDGVVSAEVIFHENPRRSSGYGFVSFKTKKQADAALDQFQGKIFMGRPLRVAKSKQFVKERVEESASSEDEGTKSEDASSELSVNGAEADKAVS